MQILFMGHYHRNYPRNACILKGLRQNGITVHEAQVELSRKRRLINLINGWRNFRRHHVRPDILMVPMIDIETFPIAWVIAKTHHIPIIYDAFECRYTVWTHELKHPINSLKSRGLYWLEGFALKHADVILVDSQEHAKHFKSVYHLPEDPFHVLYVSLDAELFTPAKKEPEKLPFIVQFIGFLHPLTGADTIVRAAALLRAEADITFEMIIRMKDTTSSHIFNLVNALHVNNMQFIDVIPYTEQSQYMKHAHICLGVFGDTEQAARVFPNKGYQALAMAKPLITRDCPALREILEPGVQVEVVPPADPQALAKAIMKLKIAPEYRQQLAHAGYETFRAKLTPAILGAKLVERFRMLR